MSVTARPRTRRSYASRVPVEQRQNQLLDAALRLVVTRGHSAATMEAVAEAAGVTKPVLYGQFANRGVLLAALLRREQEEALGQLRQMLPGVLDPRAENPGDLLADVLSHFLQAVRESPDRWHCIVMPMPDMPAEFHHARETARRIAVQRVEELARRQLDAIAAPPALDAEIVAHTLVSLFEMAARLLLTDPQRFKPARFENALRSAIGLVT